MTISLKHAFTSAKSDGADSTLVQPSNWNAEHTLEMATGKLLGRTTASTGAVEEITVGTGLTLSAGSLTADALGVSDGDKGDIVVSSSGTVWSIDSGWTGGSSIATVGTVTTGTWNGTTIAVANGGTGATTESGARTALGLAIGTDVQAYSSTLGAVAGGTYTGSSSITTLGTVATGTWQGTAIGAAYGGTGQTSYTTGDLPYASGTTTISKLGIGSSNTLLTSSGSAPQWSSASTVTGLLSAFVGDSGSGGTKGLVPAPTTGDATKYLKGDGTWGSVSASPGGSDTQLQYNNSGAFGGASGITTNGTNLTLGTSSSLLWSTDLLLGRNAAASLRLGEADAAAPVAQKLGVQSVVAGTSNTAGAAFTITGSQGTGTGAGGSLIFQVAPAGSSGTSQNALADALTINGSGGVTASDGATTNTFALRNGTTAQTFRVYNTYTNASNYERGVLQWSSNVLELGTEAAGTGGARSIAIRQSGGSYANNISFYTNSALRLLIDGEGIFNNQRNYYGSKGGGGNVVYGNTHELGSDYANLQVTLLGANAWSLATVNVNGGAANVRGGNGRSAVNSNGGNVNIDGGIGYGTGINGKFVIGATNTTLTAFGGTTSSFPALKRSSTTLAVRLADDSADAPLTAAAITASGDVTVSAVNIVTDTTTGTKFGTATGQKIGFWNATPIVQPTTGVTAATVAATGAGDVVAASTTFDGYTVGQIVKALRNAGLLA